MTRPAASILSDIREFSPSDDNWLPLDNLLAELWQHPIQLGMLETLFGVFERFPEDDGSGVLWSIVHGVEGLDLDYEPQLRASMTRQESFMGEIMLDRLERSKA